MNISFFFKIIYRFGYIRVRRAKLKLEQPEFLKILTFFFN